MKLFSLLSLLTTLVFFSPAESIPKEYSYTSKQNQITCHVSLDQDTLHLKMVVNSDMASMKILKRGLTIYFDPSGKKGKYISFNYPQQSDLINRWSNFSLGSMVENLPDEAAIIKGERVERIPLKYTSSGIKININYLKRDHMIYDLIIPTKLIIKQDLNNINKLSIGVFCGELEITKEIEEGFAPDGFEYNRPLDRSLILEQISFWFKIDMTK